MMVEDKDIPAGEEREPVKPIDEEATGERASGVRAEESLQTEAEPGHAQTEKEAPSGERAPGITAEPRRLYRSRTNRILGGVAGGIAEYLGVDPTLIRLLWVLSLFTGIGILAYIVAWIIIPENPYQSETAQGERPSAPTSVPGEVGTIIGIVLVGLGLWFLLNNLNLIPGPFFLFLRVVRSAFWPIVLILIGVIIILATSGRRTISIDTQGKRLYRSRRQRMLAGVAGGIAEYLGTDPTWVRLAWAALTIINPPAGIIAYIIAAIVIPEEPKEKETGGAA